MCNERQEPRIDPLREVFGYFSEQRLAKAEGDLSAAGIIFAKATEIPTGREGIEPSITILGSAFPELKIDAIMDAWSKFQIMNVVMAVRPIEQARAFDR